jgi:hypothetical protein
VPGARFGFQECQLGCGKAMQKAIAAPLKKARESEPRIFYELETLNSKPNPIGQVGQLA